MAHESEADLGRLTTHVLNTATGIPAADMAVRLLRADTRDVIHETRTNADGRCSTPLMEGAAFMPGKYILAFYVADYFRTHHASLSEPPFLDVVEIAVGLADREAHYHVPLLVSPWAYSTYRGS